jgi:hypothetical protein
MTSGPPAPPSSLDGRKVDAADEAANANANALPPEDESIRAARDRSRLLLLLSLVLFFLGVAGLEGLEFIKLRDQRRRAREAREADRMVAPRPAPSANARP